MERSAQDRCYTGIMPRFGRALTLVFMVVVCSVFWRFRGVRSSAFFGEPEASPYKLLNYDFALVCVLVLPGFCLVMPVKAEAMLGENRYILMQKSTSYNVPNVMRDTKSVPNLGCCRWC